MRKEVLPYVDDAWVDKKKTKIGYEMLFSRYFYRPTPTRQIDEIDKDIRVTVERLGELLKGFHL